MRVAEAEHLAMYGLLSVRCGKGNKESFEKVRISAPSHLICTLLSNALAGFVGYVHCVIGTDLRGMLIGGRMVLCWLDERRKHGQ